jgi:AcrR family transcriptional regulator
MRAPERRAQLLDVARKVFGSSGFHAASMDAVAKEAGVTKPILYDHFPSKKDLYLALLEADLATLRHEVRKALDAPTGNRERIRSSFQAYFDFVDQHAETVGVEEDFRRTVASVRDRILADVEELIVRESRGTLDPEHAELVALALIGMVETVAQREPGGDPSKRREAVNLLTRLAWRGITNL